MRHLLLLALLLPAACASNDPDRLSEKPPGLRVAQAALASGVPEAALSVARRRLAENRDDVGALLMEGQALTVMGDLSKAEASLRRATRLSPGSAGAQFGLGRVLLLASRPAEAEAAFKAALVMEPGDARTLTDLGIARDMQEHHAEAGLQRRLAGGPGSGRGAGQPGPLPFSFGRPGAWRRDLAPACRKPGSTQARPPRSRDCFGHVGRSRRCGGPASPRPDG